MSDTYESGQSLKVILPCGTFSTGYYIGPSRSHSAHCWVGSEHPKYEGEIYAHRVPLAWTEPWSGELIKAWRGVGICIPRD